MFHCFPLVDPVAFPLEAESNTNRPNSLKQQLLFQRPVHTVKPEMETIKWAFIVADYVTTAVISLRLW